MTTSIFDFPVTGVYSGLQLVNQLNAAFASLITNNAGTTPPTNPVLNQFWYDTTTGTLFLYNGTTWVPTAFGAPFVGVQIVSGGITVTPDQFGAIIEAQGQSTYSVTLQNPSDYVGVNTAVFSNINASSPVSVATAAGSILGTGSSGSSMLLPYGSLGLFVSDGYNWLAFSNAGYALLGGASTQTFDVAPAASAANAIPLAQAQTTFAGVNGNSSEVFAAANASAAQDVVNLGQAENLFPQLSGDNTFTGNQTIQGTIAVPANAGEITGGSMPSGATTAWVQAAFSSAYAGLIQNYYLNGAQVYSLSSAGDIVAHSAALTSGSVGSLTVTGAVTVPDATASDNPVALGQTTDGSLSPTFDNITTGTQTTTGNQTVNGELIVSGATNAQSATFTSLTAGSGAFTALQSNNITGIFSGSLGSSSFNTLLGGTISAGTISAGTISAGTISAGTQTTTGNQTIGGTIAVTGTASAAAGTTGNEVVNYTQITNGSLNPTFGNITTTSNQDIGGTLDVSGDATFSSGFALNSSSYLEVNSSSSGNGANIALTGNGTATPTKYLRSQGGEFQIINSGYNQEVLILTDSGNFSVGGTASASAIFALNSATLTGATAGSVTSSMPEQGVAKKWVAYADDYENDTSTAQTVTFPTAFSHPPVITTNTTGLTLDVSTTELTINAPNNATAYTGLIIVEGI